MLIINMKRYIRLYNNQVKDDKETGLKFVIT